jgi:CHAD domain-containing protein
MGNDSTVSATRIDRTAPDDAEADRLERQWFGARRAAAEARSECEILSEVMARVADSWRDARARLAELEALRDALGDALGEDGNAGAQAGTRADRAETTAMSAA